MFIEEKLWWGFLHLVNGKWSNFLAKFSKKYVICEKFAKRYRFEAPTKPLQLKLHQKTFKGFWLSENYLKQTGWFISSCNSQFSTNLEIDITRFFLWHNSFVCRLKFSSNSRHSEQRLERAFLMKFTGIHRRRPPPDEKKASRSTWRVLSTSVLWALGRHALLERGHVCTDLP